MKTKKSTIEVQGTAITVLTQTVHDYICITDIARHKEQHRSDHVIQNWMRNRNTVEFLGVWERLHNVDFNPLEFEGFRNRAGLNSFVLTPKQWIDATRAIGLLSKPGRYGGTFAHKDIAFEFASWVSVEFHQLLVLANIEGMNAEFIHMTLSQSDRLVRLNQIAIRQMQILAASSTPRLLKP
jgi:hypothetical protein